MMRKLLVVAAVVLGLGAIAVVLFARGRIGGETMRRALEQELSARVNQPVAIGSLGASFFPQVTMDLRDVVIGSARETTIAEISIATGLRGLLSRRVEGAEIIVSNSRVPLGTLFTIAGGASAGGTSTGTSGLAIVSIRQLALRNVTLVVGTHSLVLDMASSLEGDRLDVASLVARSGGMRLDAQGGFSSISRRTGAFTATAGPLNLDEVLALAAGLSGPGASTSTPLDISISLATPEGTLGGYRFEKLSSTLRLTPGHFTIEPLRFAIFGGSCTAQLKVAFSGAEPATTVSGRVAGVDMSRLLREMEGTSSMSGRMDATVSVTTRGSSSADMLRMARGTGRATIADGELSGLEMVRSAVLAFGKPSGAPVAGSGSHFTRIDATFTLDDQTLRSNDIAFASRDLDMTATGSIRVPAGAVDLHADVVLSRELTAQAGTDLRRFTQEDGRIVVPTTIGGTLATPRVSIDVAAAAGRGIQNELKRRFKGLLDRIGK